MKKIFALALAAVMTAGMTTVAFADKSTENPLFAAANGGKYFAVDFNDNGVFEQTVESDEKREIYSIGDLGGLELKGGEKVALYVYNHTTDNQIKDKDALDRYKVTAKWEEGKVDEKPVIEKIKTDYDGYVYAVTFTLPEAPATKTADLIGTVTLYKNTTQKDDANYQFDFNATIGVSAVDYADQDLADARVIDFSEYDDVAYLTFGTDFEFEVDVENQGKLNLKNNRKYNAEFAAMYDYANIDFITFENEPTFNKIGTAYIYADEDAYIYEVTADGAKAIKAEWDEDYEAWTFKTRKLTAYAVSDVELDEKTVTETEDSSKTDDGVKENPDTGR